MEEMVAYTNAHLLPHTIKSETSEVQRYIDIELDDLNRKVDDYLQKEIVRFNNEVTIQIQTNVGAAASSIVAGMVKEVGKNSLEGYFVAFGGMGGANAGVANAASHLLKRLEIFLDILFSFYPQWSKAFLIKDWSHFNESRWCCCGRCCRDSVCIVRTCYLER